MSSVSSVSRVLRAVCLALLAGLALFWLITTFPVGVSAGLERVERRELLDAQGGTPDAGASFRSYDFVHYFRAAQASREGENIYTSWNGGYVYPPLLAWMLEPLVPLGLDAAAIVWYVLIFACLVQTGLLSVRVVSTCWQVRATPLSTVAPLALAAIVFNDQVKGTLYLGQTDTILALCFSLALLICPPSRAGGGWLGSSVRRVWIAGFGLALAAHVKFLALGLLPYHAITRRWGVLWSTVVFLIVLGLLPALSHSWVANLSDLHIAFARVLGVVGLPAPSFGRFDPHPIEWARSRSILSALARVGVYLGEPKSVIIVGGTVVALGWAACAAWVYRRHGLSLVDRVLRPASLPHQLTPIVLVLEWTTLVAGLLALSPQTTKRHALILLPAVILAASIAVNGRHVRSRRQCAVALVLLVIANTVPISATISLASLPEAWRTLGTLGALGWSIALFSLLVLDAGLLEAQKLQADARDDTRHPRG